MAGLVGKVARFASSPQGRRLIARAQAEVKKPENRERVQRLAAKAQSPENRERAQRLAAKAQATARNRLGGPTAQPRPARDARVVEGEVVRPRHEPPPPGP